MYYLKSGVWNLPAADAQGWSQAYTEHLNFHMGFSISLFLLTVFGVQFISSDSCHPNPLQRSWVSNKYNCCAENGPEVHNSAANRKMPFFFFFFKFEWYSIKDIYKFMCVDVNFFTLIHWQVLRLFPSLRCCERGSKNFSMWNKPVTGRSLRDLTHM